MEPDERLKNWSQMWNEGKTFWHSDSVNKYMEQFYDVLVPNFEKDLTFFLPLCGKAGDLKWLYDKGHKVIGVEGVTEAVVGFFNDHQIKFEKTQMIGLPQGSFKYQSSEDDGRMTIYCCDFFNIEYSDWFSQTPIDCVWDRGALVAVNPSDRLAYTKLMKKLLLSNPNIRYLIMAVDYDQSKYGGPPCSVPTSQVIDLYEDTCDIRELVKFDDSKASKAKWNLDKLDRSIILLTLKKKFKENK